MRKMTEGEQRAIQILTAERITDDIESTKLLDDPVVAALYAYILTKKGMLHPRGGWINAGRILRRQWGRRMPGVWLPFPREVQPCCKKLNERHAAYYGGYWHHCLGIKHQAYKFNVPYKALRQTIYYYFKHKGGHIKAMQNIPTRPSFIYTIMALALQCYGSEKRVVDPK